MYDDEFIYLNFVVPRHPSTASDETSTKYGIMISMEASKVPLGPVDQGPMKMILATVYGQKNGLLFFNLLLSLNYMTIMLNNLWIVAPGRNPLRKGSADEGKKSKGTEKHFGRCSHGEC
jgi:hypothetical protein